MKKIGIVGGGASGLVAAITARRLGCEVYLLERQNRVGKKILTTGNGRCNLTNTYVAPKHFHTSAAGINHFRPIEKVTPQRTLDFFKELGIVPLIENEKVYPLSEQASSVLDVLRMEIESLGVEVWTDTKVIGLNQTAKKWEIKTEDSETLEVDAVIMATGGLAAPKLGCDKTGYQCLERLGHHVVTPFPTLVHILSASPYCKMMKGVRVDALATIEIAGHAERTEMGEVLFTDDGLSGPAIFQLSRLAAWAKQEGKSACVTLDFFPKLDSEEMLGMLYDRMARHPQKTIEEMLIGWVNKRMIGPIVKQAQIGSFNAACENLDYDMLLRLVQAIKSFRVPIDGTRDFHFAQATAGGICLEEIDLETMASKKHEGLYLAGELIDVDGDCGGYNLQWAWSSGCLAAYSAAQTPLPTEKENL